MKRILVIDDDRQFRLMLRQMLERAGYEVIDACNGNEGIRLYRSNPTDLVITDIIMPEKEGIETIIELKQDFPALKVIAISGGSRRLGATNCLSYAAKLGVSRVLAKPFERAALLEAVGDLTGETFIARAVF